MPLRRLVEQARRADIPLSLSVIPTLLSPELCKWVNRYTSVTVLQHGTDHCDAGGGVGPTQFDPQEAPHAIARRLVEGWTALSGFHRRLPVYVPPWHDLTPNTAAAAAMAGLESISAWGAPAAQGRVDVHLDLMRWRGPPRFAGSQRVLGRLTRELRKRRVQRRWQEPIGLLTHHLVHDDAAWRFLDTLLSFEPLKRTAQWRSAEVLFGPDSLNDVPARPSVSVAQVADGHPEKERAPRRSIRIWRPKLGQFPGARQALIGVLSLCAAWTLRWGLNPMLHDQSPYVTFALASLIAVLLQDAITGLAVTLLGGLIANYSFVGPPNTLDFSPGYAWEFALFIATTLPAIFLVSRQKSKAK